jgi:hypothetical protein
LRRYVALHEKKMGANNPQLAPLLRDLAQVLRKTDKVAQAQGLESRAKSLQASDER